jgi:hypothetical protein
MAGFKILYHAEVVRRDIPQLDPPVRRRIQIAIEERLTTRPEDFAKPLAYNRAGLWSLRVGATCSRMPNMRDLTQPEEGGTYPRAGCYSRSTFRPGRHTMGSGEPDGSKPRP